MKYFLFALFITIFINDCYAQFEKDTSIFSLDPYRLRLITSSTNKQLNTFNFNTQLKQYYLNSNFFLGLNDSFNSTIIHSSDNNIKDEHYLTAILQYRYSTLLKFGLLLTNNSYTDDRKTAINRASIFNVSPFIKITPTKNVELTPYFGTSNNKQIGESDNGYIYGTDALINTIHLDEFDIDSILKLQNEDISPRKNLLRYINLNIKNKLDENFSNIITAYFYQQRRDFYFTADTVTANEFKITNNIQSRIETNYFMQNQTNFFSTDSSIALNLLGKVSWKDVDRNTRYISLKNITANSFDMKVDEFKIDLSSSFGYRTENLSSILKISFSERDERHQPKKIEGASSVFYAASETNEAQKNNTSQLTTVTISSNYKLSENDLINFNLFHRKLKYDTPSELNYDDRDELLSILRLEYIKKLSPFFNLFLDLEGSLNKIVYIFSQRSSNNNIKRIIRLAAGGTYKGSRLISTNVAEVSANYTVFDYEDLNPNLKSFSFRQFIFRDSTNFYFAKKLSLFFLGYIKLSEQGDFNWSNFSSRPVRYLHESYAEPTFFYNYQNFTFGVGLRYFLLSTFNYNNDFQKIKVSNYLSIGPLSEISISINNKLYLKFHGWYEFITTENNNHNELANIQFNLQWKL
ncbi:hypothetical protein ABRY23_08085 [Melioribacteraceae bacterium 4301-Me]|uniref:hypothetical protein n=1 Tax=Pyranulibacter aquaticus TaxID=3163344 RepID=UPI0035952C7D